MKVIFYVAATCGNIDFHFIANLEHQFVITRSLTTLFWSLYLLHMERERLQTSGVRLEICYLHTVPPVKVLNQASPQHLSANETLSLHLYIHARLQNIIYCFIVHCMQYRYVLHVHSMQMLQILCISIILYMSE